jgi:hypothetical protein
MAHVPLMQVPCQAMAGDWKVTEYRNEPLYLSVYEKVVPHWTAWVFLLFRLRLSGVNVASETEYWLTCGSRSRHSHPEQS